MDTAFQFARRICIFSWPYNSFILFCNLLELFAIVLYFQISKFLRPHNRPILNLWPLNPESGGFRKALFSFSISQRIQPNPPCCHRNGLNLPRFGYNFPPFYIRLRFSDRQAAAEESGGDQRGCANHAARRGSGGAARGGILKPSAPQLAAYWRGETREAKASPSLSATRTLLGPSPGASPDPALPACQRTPIPDWRSLLRSCTRRLRISKRLSVGGECNVQLR